MLLDTLSFSFGSETTFYSEGTGWCTTSRDGILAYLVLPETELKKLRNKEDLEQAGSNLRVALEFIKDGLQS